MRNNRALRKVAFRTRRSTGEVILIDESRPIPLGLRIPEGSNPNKHAVLQAFARAYVDDKATFLLSLGESGSVQIIGALEKYAAEKDDSFSSNQCIDRLAGFYGPLRFGDLNRTHAIAYSWHRMAIRVDETSQDLCDAVRADIGFMHDAVKYLEQTYCFPAPLRSRIFGPLPPLDMAT